MKCVICRIGETKPEEVTVTLERAPTTLVVRGVPADVCTNCGEEYVDERTSSGSLALLDEAARGGVQVEVRQYAAA
jgi:YgiT-type zinc finger domain-containing protein